MCYTFKLYSQKNVEESGDLWGEMITFAVETQKY